MLCKDMIVVARVFPPLSTMSSALPTTASDTLATTLKMGSQGGSGEVEPLELQQYLIKIWCNRYLAYSPIVLLAIFLLISVLI